MRIQQIRNATLKIEYGDVTFLIDPWLQDKGCGFSAFYSKKMGLLQNYSEFCNTMKLANSSCGGTPQSPVRAANA